jgi:hypothetical protein
MQPTTIRHLGYWFASKPKIMALGTRMKALPGLCVLCVELERSRSTASWLTTPGKWFDIPRQMEYEIIPQTDTVFLAIQKPIDEFSDCQ